MGRSKFTIFSTDNVLDDFDFKERRLAWQPGCEVTEIQRGVVLKRGAKVQRSEETAMSLVREHAPGVPIPQLYRSSYKQADGAVVYGELYMSLVPGETLKSVWADFSDPSKLRICQDIWRLVAQIRTIPRPETLGTDFYCTADGSPSRDPLLGSKSDIAPPFPDDKAFRDRIYSRYVAHNGLSYRDAISLPDLLPQSDRSVFAHGDIGPRNIMVDTEGRILGLLDWESSGWFPDYWEFCQMMKPCHKLEHDWQHWMQRTKPEQWDITGISKARRVLF